jgi:Flp pilus assembly protein TadG
MRKLPRCPLTAIDQGSSLVETALVVPLLMLLLLGAVDFGRAFYLSMEISGAAQGAAEYGIQYPYDTSGMHTAATTDAPDVPNVTVGSPAYGCECADGTNYSASCSTLPTCTANNVVYRVNVTVSTSYSPWFPWPGVPSTLSISDSASMRSGGS